MVAAAGPERELLVGYLNTQREAMLRKADGLDRDQFNRRATASTLTIGGLIYHLALVEESWLVDRFVGGEELEPWRSVDWEADPDWEFGAAATLEPAEVIERYRLAIRRADEIIAAAGSLDDLSVHPLRSGDRFSLRWLLLHLIEETARHAGHADILREEIDGATGL